MPLSGCGINHGQRRWCARVLTPSPKAVDRSRVRHSSLRDEKDGQFRSVLVTHGASLLGLGNSTVERPWYQSARVMTVEAGVRK